MFWMCKITSQGDVSLTNLLYRQLQIVHKSALLYKFSVYLINFELSSISKNRRRNFRGFTYSNILQIPQMRTSMQGKKSYRYAAPVLWDSLPDELRATVEI